MSKSDLAFGDKQTPYSDGAQLRGFLRGQVFGTIPPVTATRVAHPAEKDRTIIITGSNTGLGYDAARQLIEIGYVSRLILACRNLSKAEAAEKTLRQGPGADRVDIQVWQLDMTSKASIAAFVDRADHELDRIDAIILNAGVHLLSYGKALPQDGGYENTLMVNVVGTMLLSTLMVPVLRRKRPAQYTPRITIVGSAVQFMVKYQVLVDAATNQEGSRILDWLSEEHQWQGKTGTERYFLSKGILQMAIRQLSAVITQASADKNAPTVIVNCAAPGLCKTELFRDDHGWSQRLRLRLMGRETEVGARSLLVGAIGVEGAEKSHGSYMTEGEVRKCSSYFETAQGEEISRRIWAELVQDIEAVKPGTIASL